MAQNRRWLELMTGYLFWKVDGPKANNAFEGKMPYGLLQQLATSKSNLLKKIRVRCLCEGYEVLRLEGLEQGYVVVSHPCLSGMARQDIVAFLEDEGIYDEIDAEVERIQAELIEALKDREAEIAEAEKEESKRGKRPKKERETGDGKAGVAARIVRRRN